MTEINNEIPASSPPENFTDFSPFYEILAECEEQDLSGITPKSLIHLLEMLEPNPLLEGFLLVLDNLIHIYPIINGFSHDEWVPVIKRICSTQHNCQAILSERSAFTKIRGLDRKIHDKGISSVNDTFRGMIGPTPLWSTLGYEPAKKVVLPHFRQLLAQVLLSVITLSSHPSYDLLQEIKLKALESIRSVAKDKTSKVLSALPKDPLPPETYLETINNLPNSFGLHYIAILIEESIDLAFRSHGHDVDPHEVDGWPIEGEILGPDYDEGAGLDEGIPLGYSILPGKSGRSTFYAEWTGAQITKALAKANQLFPFSWNGLSRLDRDLLIDFLNPRRLSEHKNVEACACALAQLTFMFWGGLSEDRLSTMVMLDRDEGDLSVRDGYDHSNGVLRLESTFPTLKTPIPQDAREQVFERHLFIDLQLPDIAVDLINLYLEKRGTNPHERIFPFTPEEIKKNCQEHLRPMIKRSNSLMTLYRIQVFNQNRLIRTAPFGDPTVAVLTLGKPIYVGRTKVHYALFNAYDLQEHYRLTNHHILLDSGYPSTYVRQYPIGPSLSLGTPKRPRKETVLDLLKRLWVLLEQARDRLAQEKSQPALIEFHNLMTVYTVIIIFYSSGKRPFHSFYIPLSDYDPVTGFCVIKDKDTNDHYHTRLIWLSKDCQLHLKQYRIYLNRLFTEGQHKGKPKEDDILQKLFFLDEDLNAEELNQGNLEERLRSKLLNYFPELNAQRHFIKSNLQEDFCAPDATELFMGHWEAGEEGFTKSSALFPYDYRHELKAHLKKLQKGIGIRQFMVPEALPVSLSLSDYSFLEDSKPKKNKRSPSEWVPDRKPGRIWFEVLGEHFEKHQNQDDFITSFNKAFTDIQKKVLEKLREKLPHLYDCNQVQELEEKDIHNFYKQLANRSIDVETAFKSQLFLYYGLRLGNLELGWDITLPTPPKILSKDKNHLHPKLGPSLAEFRRLEKFFVTTLEKPLPEQFEHRVAQILLSAILFGGLLHKDWILSFCSALSCRMYKYWDWLWLDLWVKNVPPESEIRRFDEQRTPERFRRWFADPTTQLLIYKWLDRPPEERSLCTELDPAEILTKFFEANNFALNSSKKILNALIEFGSAFAVITLPPFLVAYAKNQLPSASLPDERWLRAFTKKKIPFRISPKKQILPAALPAKIYLKFQQNQLRKELTQLIPARTRGNEESTQPVKDQIELFITQKENIAPVLFLLGKWAKYLLSKKASPFDLHKQKDPHAYWTVINYITIVAEPLFSVFHKENPLDAEDFFERYETIASKYRKKFKILLRNQKKSDKHEAYRKLIQTLRFFHRFLEIEYKTQGVQFDLLLGKMPNKGDIRVNANYISTSEYLEILDSFGWSSPHQSRFQKMAICTFIIACRLGLRRMEILGLRLKDTQTGRFLDILIRPHKGRRLKNQNAKRLEPLDQLATAAETNYVHDWIRTRRKERDVTSESYLFTTTPFNSEIMEDHELLGPIRNHLKEVTHDDATVFHHCRHSFDSNLVVTLMQRDDIPLGFVPQFLESSTASAASRENLTQAVMGNEVTGRKKLHATAILMGHSDVPTGFQSYIHFSDFLLGYYTRHKSAAPQLTSKAVSRLTGYGIKNAQKVLKKQEHPFVKTVIGFPSVFDNKLEHPLITSSKAQPSESLSYVEKQFSSPAFDEIYTKLRQTYDIGQRKYRLPLTRDEYEMASRWHEMFRSLDKNIKRKTLTLAKKINESLHNTYIQIIDFKLMTSFLELLDFMEINTSELQVTYHGSRWSTEKQQKRGEMDWREKFPQLAIARGENCQLSRKNGCIRISYHGRPETFDMFRFMLQVYLHP